jgi:hypothetical protein
VPHQKSTEEIRAEYIQKMGRELGELFDAISGELTWTYWRWSQYRKLFTEGQEQIDVLNESAPFFFYVLQGVFFEDTLLAITRLSGPVRSAGKSNLTVRRLSCLIPDVALKNEVDHLIQIAIDAADFSVDWRNRHIAHRDLALALGRSPRPLTTATQKQVEHALFALSEILNRIEVAYFQVTTAYSFGPTPDDAESLIYFLREGLAREADKRNEWQRLARGDDPK